MTERYEDIDDKEFFEMSYDLADKHAIFAKFWEIGKPVFTRSTETASVSVDEYGNTYFLFNPDFWQQNDKYTRRFIVCHEMLHLILNHTKRIREADETQKGYINAAADIVVNHLLVNKFNFDRKNIKGFTKDFLDKVSEYSASILSVERNKFFGDYRDFCWVDTIFTQDKNPQKDGNIPNDNLSLEHYYNLLEKQDIESFALGTCKNGGSEEKGGPSTADSHYGMGEINDKGMRQTLEKLNESMSNEEKSDLFDMVEEHFQKFDKDQISQQAGNEPGHIFTFIDIDYKNIKKKKKWESIIKKWELRNIKIASKDKEQWARVNRRFIFLNKDFFIPSEMEVEDIFTDEQKINVWFGLDTSGSCMGYSERFFRAASTLSEKFFDLTLFCFDTQCYKTTLESKKLYGFGGTSFSCIETFIQSEIKKENKQYPKAIFLLTDCWGDHVKPEYPKRWHVFLTESHANNPEYYFGQECSYYELRDYE